MWGLNQSRRHRKNGDYERIVVECLVGLYIASIVLASGHEELYIVSKGIGIGALVVWAFVRIRPVTMQRLLPVELQPYALFIAINVAWLLYYPDKEQYVVTLLQLYGFMVMLIDVHRWTGRSIAVEAGLYCSQIVLFGSYITESSWAQTSFVASESITERTGDALGNANIFAFSLVVTLYFATTRLATVLAQRMSSLRKAAWMFAFVAAGGMFCFQIVYRTGSRKGFISLLILLCWLVWVLASRQRRYIQVLMLPLAIVTMHAAYMVIVESPFGHRLDSLAFEEQEYSRDASMRERVYLLREGIELWLERPISGWGVDQFRERSGLFRYTHNNAIEVLANNGLLGFGALYMSYLLIGIQGFRAARQDSKKDRCIRGKCSVVAFALFCQWSVGAVIFDSKFGAMLLAAAIANAYPLRVGSGFRFMGNGFGALERRFRGSVNWRQNCDGSGRMLPPRSGGPAIG
jgi:hypothetical protein